MQYYAQDSKAAERAMGADPPFDFHVDPDKNRFFRWGCNLADWTNFFWYNQIGNVGLIGQSGAYPEASIHKFAEEACEWLIDQGPSLKLALLVGHWDVADMGSRSGMEMPAFYEKMRHLPGLQHCVYPKNSLIQLVDSENHVK